MALALASDVHSVSVAATGTARATRTRIKGLIFTFANNASITLRDGGATGTIVFEFTPPASVSGVIDLPVPGGGMLFSEDVHVTVASATAVLFYE